MLSKFGTINRRREKKRCSSSFWPQMQVSTTPPASHLPEYSLVASPPCRWTSFCQRSVSRSWMTWAAACTICTPPLKAVSNDVNITRTPWTNTRKLSFTRWSCAGLQSSWQTRKSREASLSCLTVFTEWSGKPLRSTTKWISMKCEKSHHFSLT